MFLGCKKEDEVLPTITFTSPSVSTSYQLPIGITVKAEIADDQRIDYVQIKILDADFNSVAETGEIDVEQPSISLTKTIVVDDPKITSGTHYIKIIAFDGFNEKTAFREIYLNEIPNKRKGVFYLEDLGTQYRLMRVDSNYQNATVVDQFNDFTGLEMINSYQTLVFAGHIEEDVIAYDASSLDIKWTEVKPENPPNPSFTSIGQNGDGDVLIGKITAQIQRKHTNGSNKGTMDFPENGWKATSVHGNEAYVVAIVEQIGSGLKRMDAFWQVSLQRAGTIDINFDAVKAFAIGKESEAFWLFGNENGSPVAYEWTFVGGLTPMVGSLPAGTIIDVESTRYNEYVIAYSDKVVLANPDQGQAATLVNVSGVQSVSYDDANDLVFVAHTNGLGVYNLSGGLVQTITSSNVVDVVAWMLK